MEQHGYIPGTCNIDSSMKARWDAIGTVGISAGASLWLAFILTGFPSYWQVVFVPFWTGFFGIWQSRLPLCSFRETRLAPGSMRFLLASLAAVAVTTVLAAGLLLSPMPASEMERFYTRLMQIF